MGDLVLQDSHSLGARRRTAVQTQERLRDIPDAMARNVFHDAALKSCNGAARAHVAQTYTMFSLVHEGADECPMAL